MKSSPSPGWTPMVSLRRWKNKLKVLAECQNPPKWAILPLKSDLSTRKDVNRDYSSKKKKKDKVCTEMRGRYNVTFGIYFRYRLRNSFPKIKLVQQLRVLSKKHLLHRHVETLLIISHLLVLLNFFSHFLLYGHSCQWSVGTVKHVQSPSAFSTSQAGCKMPVLISKKPVGPQDGTFFSQFPINTPTLTQHFLGLLQAAWAKISKHQKKLITSLY